MSFVGALEWQLRSLPPARPIELVEYFIPVVGCAEDVLAALPLGKTMFKPMESVPLYNNKEDAYMAATHAYRRHAVQLEEGEAVSSWLGKRPDQFNQPGGNLMPPKVVIFRVQAPVDTALQLPVRGQGLKKGAWTSLQGGPFVHFAAEQVSSSAIEFLQADGSLAKSPCGLSYASFGLDFEIVAQVKVADVLKADQAKDLQEHFQYIHRFVSSIR